MTPFGKHKERSVEDLGVQAGERRWPTAVSTGV